MKNSVRMDSMSISQEALQKIRDSNWLTEPEMTALTSVVSEIVTRRQMDALDAAWEKSIHKYVGRRARRGGLFFYSSKESIAGIIVGFSIMAYGIYMMWQCLDTKGSASLPGVFFCGALLMGIYLIIASWRSFRIALEYERDHLSYTSKRWTLAQQLPAESQRPYRLCPNCLSLSLWRA